MKRVDDIVALLTPEERELHRELIEECREREASFIEIGKDLNENIEKLSKITIKILLDIERFYKLSAELKKSCQDIKNNVPKISLALIPDDKFFHA